LRGKIIKGVGGFYYVNVENDQLYECKAKGVFRNRNIKPLVGDDVDIEIIDPDKATGNIVSILPRYSELIRPAVANADQAVILFAVSEPAPNLNLLDRFLILMEKQALDTIICFNKTDLLPEEAVQRLCKIYRDAGYPVYATSAGQGSGIQTFQEIFTGKTTVLAGPSGVGKSTMLNLLKPGAGCETGAVSEKIKRGRHTTRHSELMYLYENTYVMDTPGFSSLFVEGLEEQDLKYYFREFEAYNNQCRFNGCVHVKEPDCAVKQAVEQGHIHRERYDNYVQLFEEIKNRRKW
jgi:ribosome biogenesis GTPase